MKSQYEKLFPNFKPPLKFDSDIILKAKQYLQQRQGKICFTPRKLCYQSKHTLLSQKQTIHIPSIISVSLSNQLYSTRSQNINKQLYQTIGLNQKNQQFMVNNQSEEMDFKQHQRQCIFRKVQMKCHCLHKTFLLQYQTPLKSYQKSRVSTARSTKNVPKLNIQSLNSNKAKMFFEQKIEVRSQNNSKNDVSLISPWSNR